MLPSGWNVGTLMFILQNEDIIVGEFLSLVLSLSTFFIFEKCTAQSQVSVNAVGPDRK